MEDTRHIGYEIKTIDKLVGRHVREIMRRYGLDDNNPMKRWIAAYLFQHKEETVYQKDLETNLYIPRSTLAGLVKQMELEGLVVRREAKSDARLKQISLTEDTIAKFRSTFMEVAREVDEYAIGNIDGEKMEIFYEVLDQIKENLGGENKE